MRMVSSASLTDWITAGATAATAVLAAVVLIQQERQRREGIKPIVEATVLPTLDDKPGMVRVYLNVTNRLMESATVETIAAPKCWQLALLNSRLESVERSSSSHIMPIGTRIRRAGERSIVDARAAADEVSYHLLLTPPTGWKKGEIELVLTFTSAAGSLGRNCTVRRRVRPSLE
jgi:hypothetical protein